MKQTEQVIGIGFGIQPDQTSLNSADFRQDLQLTARWRHPIHFYLEKITPENRFRMKIEQAMPVKTHEFENLSPDTVLDLIYRLLYSAEISWQEDRVDTPIQMPDTEQFLANRQVPRAHSSLLVTSASRTGEQDAALCAISIRQLCRVEDKDINLKAAEPFTVILRLQLAPDMANQDLSASVYWVRIRIVTDASQTFIAAKEVAESWNGGLEKCKLEIPMPGLLSGQFELHVSVIFPFALKSEHRKIPINVIS